MNNELEPVAFVREDGSICTYLGVDPKPGADLYELPALTDEQVREIAEKWSRKRTDESLRPVDAFIGALNEALGVRP